MKKLLMVCSLAFAAAACAAQLSLVAPAENAEVPLITEGQKAFMDMPEAARREKMTDEAWRKELKQKTGCGDTELDEELNRLEELGFLNDRTYAASVVRSCARKGYGAKRALSELSRRGVPKELREEALEEMPQMSGTLERLIRARLRNPVDRDEVRKVSAAMSRRGYSWDEIRRALENVQCSWSDEE